MTKTIKRLIIILAIGVMSYFSFGLFLIQPIGAVPDGATIIYFRPGLNVSFISSADGFLIENKQDISLLSRAIVLGKFAETIQARKIVTLPYSRTLYLVSTGGVEFEK